MPSATKKVPWSVVVKATTPPPMLVVGKFGLGQGRTPSSPLWSCC